MKNNTVQSFQLTSPDDLPETPVAGPAPVQRTLHQSIDDEVAARIIRSVSSLRYGSVEVTVHDGRVVQIDRRERVRLDGTRKQG